MGRLRKDISKPRIRRTSWAWVWLDSDQMPIHQTAVQGFIVDQQRRPRRDQRGEYGEWWILVLVRTQEGAEPVALWVPEHQVRAHGQGLEPPLSPSNRTALFDSVASRRQRGAQNRPH